MGSGVVVMGRKDATVRRHRTGGALPTAPYASPTRPDPTRARRTTYAAAEYVSGYRDASPRPRWGPRLRGRAAPQGTRSAAGLRRGRPARLVPLVRPEPVAGLRGRRCGSPGLSSDRP